MLEKHKREVKFRRGTVQRRLCMARVVTCYEAVATICGSHANSRHPNTYMRISLALDPHRLRAPL
jgi:hypothetical protein